MVGLTFVAPRFPEWCVSGITAVLADGEQGILRNSERFLTRLYLLWDGSNIFRDHRNLAYIFSPQSCGVTLNKAASQHLAGWRACMSQFSYVIKHIPGEDNHSDDLFEVAGPGLGRFSGAREC